MQVRRVANMGDPIFLENGLADKLQAEASNSLSQQMNRVVCNRLTLFLKQSYGLVLAAASSLRLLPSVRDLEDKHGLLELQD
jgi:hypothetical protein